MGIEQVLSAIREKTGREPKTAGANQWSCHCPAHDDKHASLSVGLGDDGRVLIRCHAGCNTVQIVRAIGMTISDLFGQKDREKARGQMVAAYDYRDEQGVLLFQSVRFENKTFSQRRPDGAGGWIWNLNGVQRVLYRLPELLAADPAQLVFVVEGEKDADNVAALGLVATTNPMGAGKWQCLCDDAALRGRRVAIIPDKDEPGRAHAEDVARRLYGKAAEVRVVELPEGHGKDVSDWFESLDSRTPEELQAALLAMYDLAPVFDPAVSNPPGERPSIVPQFKTVRELVAADLKLHRPIIHGLLRQEETVNIIAPSKLGKSWMLMQLLLSVATGRPWLEFPTERTSVLLIDNELHQATSANRLPRVAEAMGISLDEVAESIAIDNLRGRLVDLYGMEEYFAALPPGRFGLIALDAFYRFLPVGADENSNAVLANLYNLLDLWATRLRVAFICVHHTSKGNQASKSVTDVGAGAGAQSRATDTHLVLRHHEQKDAVVLEAAVRSFPPVEPRCLRWMFPIWTLDPALDPTALRPDRPRRKKLNPPAEIEKSQEPAWDSARFVAAFLSHTAKPAAAIYDAADVQGLSEYKAKQLLKRAEATGKVFRWRYGSTKPVCYATVLQPELVLKDRPKKGKRK